MDIVLMYFLCPLVSDTTTIPAAMGEVGSHFHHSPRTEYLFLSLVLHFAKWLSGKHYTAPRIQDLHKELGFQLQPGQPAPRPHGASCRLSPGERDIFCSIY